MANALCEDCGGFDIEWMHVCFKHKGVEYCRGCECPWCAEDNEHNEELYYPPEDDS